MRRFISRDPIGFAGGQTNMYAYIQNNPINFKDPRGLFTTGVQAELAGFAGIGGKLQFSLLRDSNGTNAVQICIGVGVGAGGGGRVTAMAETGNLAKGHTVTGGAELSATMVVGGGASVTVGLTATNANGCAGEKDMPVQGSVGLGAEVGPSGTGKLCFTRAW